ncbi:MAG: hypothetical protein KGH84_07220 [Paracoccaceae bacterium]|nr:hypothetical protein [Paracoccaceae bacterium]
MGQVVPYFAKTPAAQRPVQASAYGDRSPGPIEAIRAQFPLSVVARHWKPRIADSKGGIAHLRQTNDPSPRSATADSGPSAQAAFQPICTQITFL